MNKKIYLLIDYKNYFESKFYTIPHRSGMNKDLLTNYFGEYGIDTEFVNFSSIDFREFNVRNKIFLYTSSEDIGYHYKSYIEDVIYAIALEGGIPIPEYKYLRATNNKVFMEILGDSFDIPHFSNIRSFHFGTLKELIKVIDSVSFPVVMKSAFGSSSQKVFLAFNKTQALIAARKISKIWNWKDNIIEIARKLKHKNYERDSIFRKKFLIQNYIQNLEGDWKILIYGDRYFIFYRPNREKDFRASGSGIANYKYGDNAEIPKGIFEFARQIIEKLKVPNLSLDIAYINNKFYLLEFQAFYFGTVGHWKSNCYFKKSEKKWIKMDEKLNLEKVYVDSIVSFIRKNYPESEY